MLIKYFIYKRAYFIFLVCLFLSCSNQEQIELTFDEFSIPIETGYLNEYTKKNIFKDYLVGYNHAFSSIDFHHLIDTGDFWQIPLSSEGPDAIQLVNFIVASKDSILIFDRRNVFLVNFEGGIEKKINLSSAGFDFDQYSLQPPIGYGNNNPPLSYFKNRIYFTVYPNGDYTPQRLGFLDLSKETFHVINNSYHLSSTEDYGILNESKIFIGENDLILYSYYTNVIQKSKWDNIEHSYRFVELESSVRRGLSDPVVDKTPLGLHKHYVEQRRYENVVSLQNGWYARVIYKTDRNSMFDRTDQYLCLFDKNGKELTNLKLMSDIKPYIMRWNDNILFEMKARDEYGMRLMKVSF